MSSKLSGHLFLRDSQDHLIVSSCPKLKSAQWDAESSTKTSEAKLTYQKIFGLIQVGRSGLGSSKHLVILNKKSHACRSLISSISKELSEEETTLRACKLQLQCSWALWESYVKKDLSWKSILAMSPNVLSSCLAATYVFPSPSNLLRWHLSKESCFLCKKKHCTFAHILGAYKISLQQGCFTQQHDSVLLKLIDSLKAFMNGIPNKVTKTRNKKKIVHIAFEKPLISYYFLMN